MNQLLWTACSLRNWLWFSHTRSSVKLGVHCSSLGSVCYELDGKKTTLLLNGKKLPGGSIPFDSGGKEKSELLEGERLHWTWSLADGIVELENRLSGRKVTFLSGYCFINDEGRKERLDCGTFSNAKPGPAPAQPSPPIPKTKPEPVKQQLIAPDPTVETNPPQVFEASHWTDTIPEEHFRRVFKHLERHGTVNEEEVTELLDSTRLARAFGNKLDSYRGHVPFEIQIEASASGQKTYRRVL